MINEDRKKLYDALSDEYDLGTYEEFERNIGDSVKRRKLYDAAIADYDLGDYESFSAQLGYKKPFKMAEPFDMNKANEESLAGLTAPQQQDYVPSPSTDSQYEGQAPVVEQAPRRGFKAGMQESWKGLKAGTQFAYGEVMNGIFGSSQDDANALYELNEMLRQGKDVASEVEGAWTDAGREIRTGALEFLPGWAIKGLKDRVYKEAEHQKVLDDIREVLGETNGDVAKARQILEERAMDLSHGDKVKLDAQRQFGNIRETEGFGAWLGENTVQMIPSASALIVGALTKSPAAARAIGMVGMGGMTAATSGSSMYEARQAGASDLETHKVGVVDGAIEYITEKLPFDNYTNWMVGKTKGKVATEVARALRSKNSPVRAEMEELLTMANKELGGKLFSKKNAAAYIADMVAEGASEFTAEASQTMTRLMYDNPDLFPLLGEALANGWQGALAGFFMGGVLGGASKTMEHHQNRERRQKQGYVDVGLVNFGTAENPDNDIVEVISVSEDTDLAQVLRDGAIINVNKNAIGQQYRYSYEAFEAGRMRVLESEALDNESVTQGMIQAADSREATAEQNLVETLRASGMADDEIMTLLDDADADKIRMFESPDIENAYNIYRDARHRARELRRTSARQAQSALNLKKLSIEENAGQFWRDNQTEDANGNPIFNPTVETGLMQDGTWVYVLSDVNEQGECAAVTENGEKKIIKADMLQDGTQVFTLDEYLQSLVDADKVQQEQTRMVEQAQDRMTQARQAAQPGTQINLGTEEDPVIGSVVEQGPDGVIVQSEAGASQLTWDEYANAMHIGAPALTDSEVAGVEAAEILSAESAYNNEVAQTESEAKEVADESGAALQEFEQADPLPRDAEGNVDETTLWNDSPARWAEWNDEQRQDGGANSVQAIDAAVAKLSATITEQQAAYGAMPVGKERNAVEQEIASLQERLAELLNVQQRYVVPVAEEVTETAAEAPAAEVAEEPAVEAANPVRETLTQLYNDPELSESEIEAFINANVQESQKALDKHLDKAPKMGTDMAKYKAERAKHQAKTEELEKQRDFWREVQSYIEMPDVTAMDMEPQNALEFTAKELTRKDGVKLQRDSFTRHTGYGSEAGNFLSMLRTKQNGGLTLEEAGERLMEMDRENGTGFFDQSDPNAGLNAILEVIGGARTSGDVSGYIKANREQLAREEMAAARNAMMEEMAQPEVEIVDNLEEDLPEDIFMRAVDETETIGGAATVRERAEAWEKRLGIKVNLIDSVDQITDKAARAEIESGIKVSGWFNAENGQVYIYVPNTQGSADVDATMIHEIIAHKGLRGYLGKKGFDALCDVVWSAMSPEAKAKYLTYANVLTKARLAEYNANPEAFEPTAKERRAAADEFIARRSESINADKNAWQKMIDSVKRFINKLTGNYSLADQLDELLEASLARYETIAKMDLQGVVEEGQTYGGIINAETGAKIDASSDIQAEGNVSFRAKDGSLVGMHNISEDKLRKAIKQGGLANPSTAVVNIDEYSLEEYGEISLIMPSSLVDPETGDNAGTYSGDAWTPTYPPISRKVDDRGWKVIKDRIRAAVGEESALYSDIVHGVDNYLDDNHRSKMEFVFLKEKGIEPEIKYKGAEGLVGIRNLEAILGVEGLRDGWESYEKYKAASPMSKRSFNMWVDSGGDKTAHRELKEMLKKEPKLADVLKLNEDLPFSRFDSFTYHIWKTERDAGRVDTYDTMAAASSYVDANNLRAEFEQWLESLMEQAGAREVFFAGFTRDGDRIYKDNTLENVSRHMRMQGRTNVYDDKGLSATKSALLERFESLSQIRRNRGRLADERTYSKAYDELKDRLYNIISQLSDMETISSNPFINLDYAESRLQDALTKRNPVAYLNKEYGYSIDPKGEYASELKSFIKDVQKMPAKYFETKFERPVYLNEFAAAVVPATTGEDIKQAISEAGLPIYEYDSSVEGARHEATLKATDDNDVRFRIIGEEGAANLDAAEEASVRLDNLTAAREMEAAGKDAKAIKLATGWERGTDNLWRYEVPDDFDLTELENRLQENLNDGMSKAWGIVYPSDLGDLTKEYPDFNVDIMVWVGDEFENTGEYSPATEGDENTFGRSASIEVKAKTVADIKSVLVHEIQHVIQEKEGFAEGGNAFGLKDKLSAELDKRVERIKELRAEGRDAEADELMSMSKGLAEAVINNEDDAYGNYRKLAGEVEARNASARLGMTMQERMEVLLSETEDVAREDQIILMDSLGIREMGHKTDVKMAEVGKHYEDKTLDTTQKTIIDTYSGVLDNTKIIIKDETGVERSIVMRQGNERNFGTKHSLFRHYGTNTGVINADDIALIPKVLEEGKRTEKANKKVDYVLKIGKVTYTVYTRKDGNSEVFYDFYSSWRIKNKAESSMPTYTSEGENTQLSARTNDASALSADKGSNNFGESNTRFRVSNENQAIFVSNAAKAVEGIKQEKATPEQWLKMIEKNGGLKAGEDKWMGLSDWLKSSDKKTLTKAEVLNFINENMIIIEEQHYEEFDYIANLQYLTENFPGYERAFDFEYDERRDKPVVYFTDEEEAAKFYNEHHSDKVEFDEEYGLNPFDWNKVEAFGLELAELHYSQRVKGNIRPIHDTRTGYITRGLENPHEIALTVPTIESWNESDEVHFGDAGYGRAVAWIRFGETIKPTGEYGALQAEYERLKEVARELYEESGGRSNELAELEEKIDEMRTELMSYKNPENAKVLVIDEIQSKRHQEGREKGYLEKDESYQQRRVEWLKAKREHDAYLREMDEKYGEWLEDASEEEIRKTLTEEEFNRAIQLIKAEDEARKAYQKRSSRIPDAPFDKNWHELAMKRMLRYAAENGYDAVAWTKGEQQADRYSMTKHFTSIEREDNPSINGRRFQFYGGNVETFIVDENGIVTDSTISEANGKPLADVVGKELSIKMMSIEDGDALDDQAIAVGGEGMKGFYDKMLPAFMNKYGKKWGVKVEDINLPNLEDAAQTMHSIPVTEEMKASVMEGQVMFRVRGENESAMDFHQSMIDAFLAKYEPNAEVKLYPINRETAKEMGVTIDELKKIRGMYLSDEDIIAIFANEEETNGEEVENSLFHESIHKLANFYPYMVDAGKWLWDNAFMGSALTKHKDMIEQAYANAPEEARYEEMLAWTLGSCMEEGCVDILASGMPANERDIIEQITNEIGYDIEKESIQRTGRKTVESKEPGKAEETRGESAGEGKDLGEEIRFRTSEITPEVRAEMNTISAIALVNGTYLKAPNGADTNLTPEQWALVRTKNFIRWFGDWINDPENASKVVDENGEPRIMHHGSDWQPLSESVGDAVFNMNDGLLGKGAYFASSLMEATMYAEIATGLDTSIDGNLETLQDEYVSDYFLNIRDKKDIFEFGDNDIIAVAKSPSQIKSATDNTGEFSDENGDIRYRIVTDPAKIEELENGQKIKVYRAMQLIDGKLYPPMSAKVDGQLREPIELGQWEEAEERPDLADNKGYFKLNKGNKKSIKARYNPYFHTSPTPLNDQFSSAQSRPELVTVEVEIPESELTSGYKAEKAKDSVGEQEWKAGVVQSKLSGTRTVILSRWDKPIRIVPDSEVADVIVKMFEGKDIVMPSNVVTPSLRAELESRGVPFVETDNQGNPIEDTRFRVTGTPTEQVVAEGVSLSPADMARVAGRIFSVLPEEARREVTASLNGNILGLQDAIMQIPTRLAMKQDWDEQDMTVAETIAAEMDRLTPDKTRPFSTYEGLWILYDALTPASSLNLMDQASRAIVKRNLGVDEATLERMRGYDDDVRFRTVGDATVNAEASLYNRGASNVWTRLKESFVDMNASVEQLVKAIEKKTGMKAQGFENILNALNQQSSKGLAAMKGYTRKYLKPMFKAIREIMDNTKFKYEDIVRYVILKHGLERNKKLAQRDARAHYQEIYDDIITKIKGMSDAQKRTYLTNAQLRDADAKAELATLQNVNTSILTDEQKREHKRDLAKARKAVEEAAEYLERAKKIASLSEQEAQDELDKIFENIENGTDGVYQELRKNDYSGISSMFYDQLGVDRKDYSTEEQYQSALMLAKNDKYSTLADVEAAAEAEVKKFEGTVSTKDLWEKINAATKETLRQQYEANMISKDQYESLRNMFEYYVPLRGFKDNTAEDMYTYYRKPNSTGYTKPILGAEGRKTEAESPFGWIAAMAGSAVASNVKNQAKLALYYFVSNRPENGIATLSRTWFVDSGEVDADGKKIFKPAYPPFTEDLSSDAAKASYEAWQENMRELQKKGQAYESGQRLNLGNAVVNISDVNKPEHIVNVKVAGKDYTILINGNPRAAQAINGQLNIEASAQDYTALFGPVLRWMSSVNTSYNPEFWITNMMRDMLFTFMSVNTKEDAAYRRKFAKNYLKAFKVMKMVHQNEKGTIGDSYLENMYKDFEKNGGVTGYTQIKGSEEWEKEIAKQLASEDPEEQKAGKMMRKVKDVFSWFHRTGESLEQVSRFAAFLTAREMGKPMSEAIDDAKEITVNFNRKGSGKRITLEEARYLTDKNGQPLNAFQQWMAVGLSSIAPLGRRTIMFFNAAMQGLNATAKLVKKNPQKMAAWSLAYFAIGVMNAVLHNMFDDDDDYLDMPEYERRNALMLGGNGVYFKWALPQEMRMIYGLGDLAVEAILGRNPHESTLAEAVKIVTEVLPINPTEGWRAFLPSVAIPFVELGVNEDYKGDPIYNEQKWLSEGEKERTAKWSSAYKSTGRVYIEIAKALNSITGGDEYDAGLINLQPEKIEYLVQSAFGGTVRTADKALSTLINGIDPEESMTVRQWPFLNRVLTLNDERYKNVHVNDVFEWYENEVLHAISLEKKYKKEKQTGKLEELKASDEYKWIAIYKEYEKDLKLKKAQLKAAPDTRTRMELTKAQDEIKKKVIKEISALQ